MKDSLQKLTARAIVVLVCALSMTLSVYAGVDNPAMGDTQGRFIGVALAILGVSLVVVIAVGVASSKKKKK